MLQLKAQKGYMLVNKAKDFVYGNSICAPDSFDDYIEVTKEEAQEIEDKLREVTEEEANKLVEYNEARQGLE